MAYIQKLPILGTGKKLFPDATMHAGTRGLVDMIDGWSWGGQAPASGSTIAAGVGPKNYPLAEDGWVEDAGSAVVPLGYLGGGVLFDSQDDCMKLPRGFEIDTADTDIAYVIWARNLPAPGVADGFGYCIFAAVANGVQNFALNLGYTSGAITGGVVNCRRTGSTAMPAAFLTAFSDGALHQIGVRFQVQGSNGVFTFYLDGVQVSTSTRTIINPWQARVSGDYAALGRHQIFSGCGLNGRVFRSYMETLSVTGSRPFAETIALDYDLNAGRIQSALGG